MTRDGSHHGLQWRASPHQHLTEQHGEKPWYRRLTLLPIGTLRRITTAEFHFFFFISSSVCSSRGESRSERSFLSCAGSENEMEEKFETLRLYSSGIHESSSHAPPPNHAWPCARKNGGSADPQTCTSYAASGTGLRNCVVLATGNAPKEINRLPAAKEEKVEKENFPHKPPHPPKMKNNPSFDKERQKVPPR